MSAHICKKGWLILDKFSKFIQSDMKGLQVFYQLQETFLMTLHENDIDMDEVISKLTAINI